MDTPVVRDLHLVWFLAGLPDWVHRIIYLNGIKLSHCFSERITKGYDVQALLPACWTKNSLSESPARLALVPKGFGNDFGGVN